MAEVKKYMVIVLEGDEVTDFEAIMRHAHNRIKIVVPSGNNSKRFNSLIGKLMGWCEEVDEEK